MYKYTNNFEYPYKLAFDYNTLKFNCSNGSGNGKIKFVCEFEIDFNTPHFMYIIESTFVNKNIGLLYNFFQMGLSPDFCIVNKDNFSKKSLLYMCCYYKLPEFLDLVLSERPNINCNNNHEKLTPLMICIKNDFTHGIDTLIKYGAKTNVCAYDGSSTLRIAFDSGKHDICAKLLEKTDCDPNFDPNIGNYYYQTNLLTDVCRQNLPYLACKIIEKCNQLKKYNCLIPIKNNDGRTYLDYIEMCQMNEVKEQLNRIRIEK